MKIATIYQRGKKIFVHASSRTTAGVWILSGAISVIDEENIDRLGELVLDALHSSQEDVPHPRSWSGLFDPLLKLANIKSWSTFTKASKCVEVELDGGRVSIIPTVNLGAKEGFKPVGEKVRNCTPSNEELNKFIVLALQDAS